MLKKLKEKLAFKSVAREPVSKVETYLKFGFVITEIERYYCPRCGHCLNVGSDYQCEYCSQCGQRLTFDGITWKEEKDLRCVPYEQWGNICESLENRMV